MNLLDGEKGAVEWMDIINKNQLNNEDEWWKNSREMTYPAKQIKHLAK
jgi:hypothetical protein